mgnify:CR=1 FL=1
MVGCTAFCHPAASLKVWHPLYPTPRYPLHQEPFLPHQSRRHRFQLLPSHQLQNPVVQYSAHQWKSLRHLLGGFLSCSGSSLSGVSDTPDSSGRLAGILNHLPMPEACCFFRKQICHRKERIGQSLKFSDNRINHLQERRKYINQSLADGSFRLSNWRFSTRTWLAQLSEVLAKSPAAAVSCCWTKL